MTGFRTFTAGSCDGARSRRSVDSALWSSRNQQNRTPSSVLNKISIKKNKRRHQHRQNFVEFQKLQLAEQKKYRKLGENKQTTIGESIEKVIPTKQKEKSKPPFWVSFREQVQKGESAKQNTEMHKLNPSYEKYQKSHRRKRVLGIEKTLNHRKMEKKVRIHCKFSQIFP